VILDFYGYISDNKTKNNSVIKRFEDLEYGANLHNKYALDEEIGSLDELFRSYKTVTLYDANILKEDGQFEIMSFDTEDAYKKYIRSFCDENEVEHMVYEFLRQREKKVYYEPLFNFEF